MELPNTMGLRGTHSPKALQRQGGLSFCPWCKKEGQNEGTVVNHLRTSHYHLGFICSCCVEYFTMSTDAMHWHSQLCRLVPANDNDWGKESVNNDSAKEYDDEFGLYED